MNGRRMLFRFRASMVAACIGWAAALVATLPMVLSQLWSDAIGGWRQLLWSLAAGVGIWLAWTLAIVSSAWLCAGLPLALLVREDWLMRHRRLAMAISLAGAGFVLTIKFQLWKAFRPFFWTEPWLLSLYALLLLVFAAASMAAFLRLIARRRASEANDSLPR
jgi:hypothetical protein